MRPFATHYDLIYADKDYAADIAAFEALVNRPLSRLRVLEIGAGSGGQSIALAPRVRALAAVEIDADFAELFRAKLERHPIKNLTLHAQDVSTLRDDFDAAAAFFHVLNYVDAAAMPAFLLSIARNLKPGALFVADLWSAEAVLADPPRAETREKQAGGKTIRQSITPTLDAENLRVRLHYDVAIGGEPEFSEDIELHLWPRADLDALLHAAGFEDIAYHDYRRFPAPATPQSWRVWLSCRRR